ncbi:hypothetical protein OKA04_11735 [Luteolibacter flavescens]|uniref:Uncharacterized protein n=1 Tax=Luteolibacter flavescens TaxID=1859460 RepID=A0ABT3FP99_9BACT|nr:hypothetical protein [Luteolibacter flavescens]MCW1885401.1 hypothetical protein [Luteolibacter flavescens]
MSSNQRWLEAFTWEFVCAQNEALCQAKSAHHGPTSDGHEATRALWQSSRSEEMDLYQVIDLCRRCHRLAPFTNFNGNTFSAIARVLVRRLNLPEEEEHIVRSLAGHIVAGVAGDDEIRAFRDFCASLS